MENRNSVDQRRSAVGQFLARHHVALVRQGAVVATYRRRAGRTLGPYYRLTCRSGGRQVAVYLGGDQGLIGDVRERLASLQQARLQRTELLRVRRGLRSHAREARRRLDTELDQLGLYRQGHEIRGWRTASLGTFMPPSVSSPVTDQSITH